MGFGIGIEERIVHTIIYGILACIPSIGIQVGSGNVVHETFQIFRNRGLGVDRRLLAEDIRSSRKIDTVRLFGGQGKESRRVNDKGRKGLRRTV